MVLAGQTAVMAGPFEAKEFDGLIPADKKLSKEWIASLYARGSALSATGDNLKYIGMPINGVCTGQVYLGGDGSLWNWNLTARKDKKNNPKGLRFMQPDADKPTNSQGFAIEVDGKTFRLDSKGFENVRFTNHAPMAMVDYADDKCPVQVQLEAYTPFIPLNRDDSSFPVIVMRYTVTNLSSTAQEVAIGGWIENISNKQAFKKDTPKGKKIAVYHEHDNISEVECSANFDNKKMNQSPGSCTIALGVLGDDSSRASELNQKQIRHGGNVFS